MPLSSVYRWNRTTWLASEEVQDILGMDKKQVEEQYVECWMHLLGREEAAL